jgi:hypothetical protein
VAVLAGGQPVGATPDLRYPGLSSLCPSIPLQVDGSSHLSCSMDDPVHSHKPTMAGWLRDQSLSHRIYLRRSVEVFSGTSVPYWNFMLSVEHESDGSGEDSGFIPQRLTVEFHFLATHQARRTLVGSRQPLVSSISALRCSDSLPPFHSLCIIPEKGHGIGTR